MRTLVFGLLLFAGIGRNLYAGDITSPELAKMGLGGVQRMSDREGSEVRGSPYLVVPLDGGTFQVYFAHFVAMPYNTLPFSGFQAGFFPPLVVPLAGGVGVRGR